MKLILASAKDQAAKNIAARLLELYDFEESKKFPDAYTRGDIMLMMIAGEATQVTGLTVDADEVIVASRHASESSRATLTVHVPGEPERVELAKASPPTVKSALKTLALAREELGLDYEISLEATHHGPTELEVPVTFVEIGSTRKQWCDEKAGEAVARAIMAAATSPTECRQAVGLGGPHYAPRHTEVVLHTDVGIGHIFPKYIPIDERLVDRAIAHTRGGVELLVLDWKGMNAEQRSVSQRITSRLGISTERVREILLEAKL